MTKEEKWLLDDKYGGEKNEGFFTDLERLKAGEPLGYIIGFVPFLESKIWLDNRPLIPRPETEYWVEKAINEIRNTVPRSDLGKTLGRTSGTLQILDLCAGSGAIGVSIAKAIPDALVDLAEIDLLLLPTIEKNLKENVPDYSSHGERYRALQSDLYENVVGSYDYILTNPPYIDPALDRAQASVKDFEPHLALYGGKSGMEIIEKIIVGAVGHLNASGQLWIEHEPEQSTAIQTFGTEAGFSVSTHTDQYEVARFSVLLQ